ncbi:ribosomal-processing cysteine protease Prp [Thermoanaerobacterium sp. DL9XJH110]|uniref:ribosomal-processing cysteine protease Prp n=1 Tax=Thermoanaerobacterium sp. DL9XJH110 TaxID=3386643 RepID=UPI003BB63CF8
MIRIEVVRDAGEKFKRLEISGHAGYAEYGRDIVCAAVSALAETAALGLEKIAGVRPLVKKREGYFLLKLPENINEDAYTRSSIIIETICLGLVDMSKSYPSHVQVKMKKEVQ